MYLIKEHYHIYNRGAHKAPIFLDKSDYERFVSLLFVANDKKHLPVHWAQTNFWSTVKNDPMVDIFAYCLMPNHFHIGIAERCENGIEKFIHKLITAYSMYYNRKYSHSGTIFQGNYKSKHINNDDYLRYLIEYIHLNPFGIEEPDLIKTAKPEYLDQAIKCAKEYEYSSFKDYLGETRPQNAILQYKVYPRG